MNIEASEPDVEPDKLLRRVGCAGGHLENCTININLNIVVLSSFKTSPFDFDALALLRVARNPSSVGWPTPKTGKPFTWIQNKRVLIILSTNKSSSVFANQVTTPLLVQQVHVVYRKHKQINSFKSRKPSFNQMDEDLSKVGCSIQLLHLLW